MTDGHDVMTTYQEFVAKAEVHPSDGGEFLQHVACPFCGQEMTMHWDGETYPWSYPWLSCDDGCGWNEFI